MPKPQTQCQKKLDEFKEIVAWNSGKTITQLGLYDGCLQQSDQLKYGMLQFLNATTLIPLGIQMGVCVPKICSKQQIETQSNPIFKQAGLLGEFIDEPQNITQVFGVQFYLALSLFGIIGLVFLIATLLKPVSTIGKNKAIQAFNLVKNVKAFEYKPHNFNVFNGVKSICMMWVIFGHTFSARLQNSVNALSIESHVQGWFYLFVLSAFFAVDVFFYIGGFLVAYSFLRNKMKSIMKYPLAILHRVLRFWPSYIMAMLFFYGIMIHLGDGPLWWKVQGFSKRLDCEGMWKSIIFLDNIIDNGQKICMGWAWYLQNDMQIFVLSIPILFLYNTKRKFAFITIILLIIASLTYNFIQVQVNEYITVAHRQDFAKWAFYFPNVYIKPWVRCPPYLYGLFLGLLFMEFKKQQTQGQSNTQKGLFMRLKIKLQQNIQMRRIIQLIGLIIVMFIILIPRTLQVGHKWPQVVHSFYLTFGKLFFVIGVSMLLTPSLLGIKNDLVFFLMDTKFFHFIGKVSFWTYLIHYNLIVIVLFSQKVDFYYNAIDILPTYIPIAIISICCGFIGTILIQMPFADLQKMLVGGKGGKKKGAALTEQEKDLKNPLLNETVDPNSLKDSGISTTQLSFKN